MLFNADELQLMGRLTGSETYPLAVHPAGTAAQSAALWGTNLLITLTFAQPDQRHRRRIRDVALRCVQRSGVVLCVFHMPDLTGASLEEIERELANGHFRHVDFARPIASPSAR